jgi:glycosyltransferase involved in cell wall biosynthesis
MRSELGRARPLVSVVLPTHNRVDLLVGAVESVLAQTEQSFELIVVDDGSRDATPEYLAALTRRNSRTRSIRLESPRGGGAARNEGIRVSQGDWVAFLDDDDRWFPTKLEKQLAALRANPTAVAASCCYEQVFASNRRKVVAVPSSVSLSQLFESNVLGGASLCLASAQALGRIAGFDTSLVAGQDLDLWVRLRQLGEIVVCSEPLVLYQAHDGPRITNNRFSVYAGSRRFYFKHRHLMDETLRRHRVANASFLMSRLKQRSLCRRARFLLIAIRNAKLRDAIAYARSSLPRLLRDAVDRRDAVGRRDAMGR